MGEKQQPPTPPVPSICYGPYRPTALLGRGGMGVVYRASHTETGEEVALKTLHTVEAMVLARMRREIASLARLRHPGVVKIVEHGVHEGCPWYAMELIEGMTLSQLSKLPQFDTSQISRVHSNSIPLGESAEADLPQEEWWTTCLMPAEATGALRQHGAMAPTPVYAPEPTQQGPAQASGEQATRRLHESNSVQVPARLPTQGLSLPSAPEPAAGKPAFPEEQAQTLLTLVRRICAPLAYLHGEGIVHRDLKPGNLLFLSNGRPVLVDFGLSADLGGQAHREKLHDDFHTYGTPGYMAPEQILGQTVDARCDLYALGCILFKLLAGRLPFVHHDPMKIYQQHLHKPPPPLSTFYRGVPVGLQRLLDRLLAKDPHERLGYAMDVAAWLVDIGADDDPLPGPTARPYLYQPGFVGREAPLETMLEHIDPSDTEIQRPPARSYDSLEAVIDAPPLSESPDVLRPHAHRPQLLFVEGERGVGKTRFLVEVIQQAHRDGIHVFPGRCLAPAQAPGATSQVEPLAPLRQPLRALADQCLERGSEETERIFGGHRLDVLASFEPLLRQLLKDDAARPPALSEIDANRRLLDALLRSFEAARPGHSILLVLDDLQWADPLTIALLSLFVNSAPSTMVRVIAAYRREEAPRALLALQQLERTTLLSLSRLDDDGIRDIICKMLAVEEIPGAFANAVIKYAQGNPFFAAEYLRMALIRGYISRDEQGAWIFLGGATIEADEDFALPVPSSVRQLLEERLRGISDAEQSLLEWVATWGKPFDEPMMETWQLDDPDALPQLLDSLCQRLILEEPAPSHFQLNHTLLQELIYDAIEPARKRKLHGLMAQALANDPQQRWSDASVAFHWRAAGNKEQARAAYLRAAHDAVARTSLSEAGALFLEYIELSPPMTSPILDGAQLEATLSLATKVHIPQGSFPKANERLSAIIAWTEQYGHTAQHETARAQAQLHLGFVYHALGQIEQADASLHAALGYFEQHDQREDQARALRFLGIMQAQKGEYERATTLFEQSLEIWDKLHNLQEQGQLLANLGSIYFERSQIHLAVTYQHQALALFTTDEHLSIQGSILNNLLVVYLEQGQFQQAREYGLRSLEIRRALGDRRGEGYVLNNLAYLAYRERDYVKAHTLSEEAIALWRSIDHPRGEGYALINMGSLRRDLGDFEGARLYYEQGQAISNKLKNPHMEGHTYLYQAVSFRYQGRRDEAREYLNTAMEIVSTKHQGLYLCCLVEEGFQQMDQGLDATESHEQAEAIAQEIGLIDGNEWHTALCTLKRAVDAFAAGEELLFGQHPDDIPPPLLRSARRQQAT